MKKFFTRAVLTLAVAACCAGVAPAQGVPAPQDESEAGARRGERMGRRHRGPRGERPGHKGRRGKLRGLRQLDLSDAQREQLRAIREKYHDHNQQERTELRALWKIRKDGGQLTPEQEARSRELIHTLRRTGESIEQEMLGVLTPEQRTQLEQNRKEFEERREERRQRRQELRERRPRENQL